MLLFFLAVVPAVGEEFMLRGLIGRGLVARWGVVCGVLITSCLFAGLHMYPPHVAAIFPVGIMMHIAYLTTRSFWAPMLLHFMNNGIAALYTSLGLATTETAATADEAGTVWEWLPYAAPPYVLLCIWLLWKYRTEYIDENGGLVWPGYHSVEHPDPGLPIHRRAPNSILVAVLFGLLFVGEMGMMGVGIYEQTHSAPKATDTVSADEFAASVGSADRNNSRSRPAGRRPAMLRIFRTVATAPRT